MKKLIVLVALMVLVPIRAHATASALAVDVQDVAVSSPLPSGKNTIGSVGISSGTNTLKVLSDGSINVNTTGSSVSGSTIQVTGLNGGPVHVQQDGSMTVTPGSGTWTVSNSSVTAYQGGAWNVGVNGPITVIPGTGTWSVNGSTVGIQGSQGKVITSSSTAAGGTSLQVVNTGRANLDGKTMVYASSNAMVTNGVLTLTGLGNSVDLQAFLGVCTFTINGGTQIQVSKNTSESYTFDYTLLNPSVTLVSQDVQSVCKVRIVGAN